MQARPNATAEMLILGSSLEWRAPGKHFLPLTKASHAVDSPVKNTLPVQENTPRCNVSAIMLQVEHVDPI
jgi:hypothetical protein